MSQPENQAPKSPTSHLHVVNLIVALLAGVISITGGIYSLKNNLFSGPQYGSLQGVVRDEKIAKPLKLAAVEISDLAGVVVNTATTDDNGHYLIEALKTGNYVVKFTAPIHKVETKTIKIEKDLASSINVDLVPETSQTNLSAVESMASVPRMITQPYVPATPYQAPVTVTSYQGAAPAASSVNTVPSTYPPAEMPQDPSTDPRYSGYPRRHPRRYPGSYDQTTSPDTTTSSQGSALATAGAQLLQALMAKKTEDSPSTTSN